MYEHSCGTTIPSTPTPQTPIFSSLQPERIPNTSVPVFIFTHCDNVTCSRTDHTLSVHPHADAEVWGEVVPRESLVASVVVERRSIICDRTCLLRCSIRLYILPHQNSGQMETFVRVTLADAGVGISEEKGGPCKAIRQERLQSDYGRTGRRRGVQQERGRY
jgi:hypothetical protein